MRKDDLKEKNKVQLNSKRQIQMKTWHTLQAQLNNLSGLLTGISALWEKIQ